MKNKNWFKRKGIEKLDKNLNIHVSEKTYKTIKEIASESGKTISEYFRKLLGMETTMIYPELFGKSESDKSLFGQILITELALLELVGKIEIMRENIKEEKKLETINFLSDGISLLTQRYEHFVEPFMTEFREKSEKEDSEKALVIWKSFYYFINKFSNSKSKIKALIKLCEVGKECRDEFSTDWIKNEIKNLYF